MTALRHSTTLVYELPVGETAMHPSTFEYLTPTGEQQQTMEVVRKASAEYASVILANVPEGPDRTYLLRKLREVAMWSNVAITRNADGSPRA
jgi:hypothetical protein